MPLDDSLHGGETDAGARELRAMEPLERDKQLLREAHIEAGAVIAYEEDPLVVGVFRGCSNVDACLCTLAGELPGVAKQVVEQRACEARVGVRFQPARDRDLDPAFW